MLKRIKTNVFVIPSGVFAISFANFLMNISTDLVFGLSTKDLVMRIGVVHNQLSQEEFLELRQVDDCKTEEDLVMLIADDILKTFFSDGYRIKIILNALAQKIDRIPIFSHRKKDIANGIAEKMDGRYFDYYGTIGITALESLDPSFDFSRIIPSLMGFFKGLLNANDKRISQYANIIVYLIVIKRATIREWVATEEEKKSYLDKIVSALSVDKDNRIVLDRLYKILENAPRLP